MTVRLIAMLCMCGVTCSPYLWASGATSGAFLRIGIGARATAMGETGTTDVSAESIHWNPAGLALLRVRSVSFMHAAWIEASSMNDIAMAIPAGDGTMGVAVSYFSVPDINRVDNTGLPQGGSYSPSDIAVKLAYARPMWGLPMGGTVKYISSSLDDQTATAVAADGGVMLQSLLAPGRNDIRIGVSFLNAGSRMKYVNESFSLPFTVRAGVAYMPVVPLTLAIDVDSMSEMETAGHFGIQYLYGLGSSARFAGRLGYRTNTRGLDGMAGITAGIGVAVGALQVDYAFVPYGDLNDTHRVSITYGF